VGVVVMLVETGGVPSWGPSALELPSLSTATFAAALTALVIPQLPLTFANSCLAPADAARTYFGERARRITPGRLSMTLGSANIFSGAIAGMPVCHGAGGLTAHYAFGARTGRAPLALGCALLVVGLAAGSGLAVILIAFPLPILAGLLATAGLLHIQLLKDLRGAREWSLATVVGTIGFGWNLAIALGVGLVLWWTPELFARIRSRAWSSRLYLRFLRQSSRP